MKRLTYVSLGVLLTLTGCSETKPAAEKKSEPPAEPVTGRKAVYQMYQVARTWAPDAQILQLKSQNLQEVKSGEGTAGAWQAIFFSPSKSKARSYSYSVVEVEGLHKGTFAQQEENYSPHGTTKPFLIAALKIDSDEALKASMKKAEAYASKNPKMPINYLLEGNTKYPNPTWRVIWGESVGTSNFSIFVDASTGEYLDTMH